MYIYLYIKIVFKYLTKFEIDKIELSFNFIEIILFIVP